MSKSFQARVKSFTELKQNFKKKLEVRLLECLCFTLLLKSAILNNKNIRKRGGEISSPLAYEEVDAIATIVELVREVVEPVIQSPFELVDIEYGKIGSDMILSIFVDKPEGITLNDTADLTEMISPVLDTIKPDPFPDQYFLEITSPGLERPLKTKDAVAGAVGKYIHVGLYQAIDKQKVFEGTLLSFEEDELTMEYMDKTRKKTVQIPYSLVSKARLAVKL